MVDIAKKKAREFRKYHSCWRWRIRTMVGTSRLRAKKQGWDFDLTAEFIENILEDQGYKCGMTNRILRLDPPLAGMTHAPDAPSIDRIDSTRGYTKDNIRLVCWMYNRAKAEGTDDAVLEFARSVLSAQCSEEPE